MADTAGPPHLPDPQAQWAHRVHEVLRLMMEGLDEGSSQLATFRSVDGEVDGHAVEIKESAPVQVLPKPRPGEPVTAYLDMLQATMIAADVDVDSYQPAIQQLRVSLADRTFSGTPGVFEFRCYMTEMVNGNGITKQNYDALRWLMGARKLAPGEAGFSMRMARDGKIEKRFNGFARETVKELTEEFDRAFQAARERGDPAPVISPSSLANRHVVPAHMMREAYNSLVDLAVAEGGTADDAAAKLNGLFDHAVAHYTTPEVKATPRGALFNAVLEVATRKATELKEKLRNTANKLSDAQYKVLIAMFVINSNPENLWRGNAGTNSALPRAYNKAAGLGTLIDSDLSGAPTPRAALGEALTRAETMRAEATRLSAGAENDYFRRYLNGVAELATMARDAIMGLSETLESENKLDAPSAVAEAVGELETFLAELLRSAEEAVLAFEIDMAQDDRRGYERDLAHARVAKPSVAKGAEIAAIYQSGGTPSEADIAALFTSLLRYDEL